MAVDPTRLEELILNGEVEEALALVTLEQAADAWCSYYTRTHDRDEDDPDWWAIDLLLSSEFWSDERRIRAMLLLLVERAQDDHTLAVIGAGPLQDFISDHEDRLIWIEQRAAASERFREALGHVWVWRLTPETLERVERAAGTTLARPQNSVDLVPGGRPGTVHITVNDESVSQIEVGATNVDYAIEFLKRLTQGSDQP